MGNPYGIFSVPAEGEEKGQVFLKQNEYRIWMIQ